MTSWTLLDLWPGIWLLVLATVLHFVLRRWFDPVPLRAWAVFAFICTVLFGKMLFLGATVGPLDKLAQWVPFEGVVVVPTPEHDLDLGNPIQNDVWEELLPWLTVVRRSYLSGHLPLWDPYSGPGAPLLANPQALVIHPFLFLTLPVGDSAALPLTAALRILTILVFLFLFCRRLGLDEGPALFVAVVFALSGFPQHFLLWPHTAAVSMTTLALYAVVHWFDRRSATGFALLVTSLWALLVSGHPETILHGLVAIGLVSSARVVGLLRRAFQEKGTHNLRVVATSALAALLAGGLAAPVLLPAAEYLPNTDRFAKMEQRNNYLRKVKIGDLDSQTATTGMRVIPIAAPNAYGSSRHRRFWGFVNSNEASTGFAGTPALAAALLVLLLLAKPRGKHHILFAALAVVVLVVVLNPPGLPLVMARLPLFDRSPLNHRRALWLLALCLSYLAGTVLQRWKEHRFPWQKVVPVAAGLGALIVWSYVAHRAPQNPAAMEGYLRLWMGVQLFALTTFVCLVCSKNLPWKQWTLLAIATFELFVFHAPLNPAIPKTLYFPPTPITDWLSSRQTESPGYRVLGHRANLPAQLASIYGLMDPRSSGPSQAEGFRRLVARMTLDARGQNWTAEPDPLLDLMAVRYVVGRRQQELPYPRVFEHGSGVVWERPTALPLLFLPTSATATKVGDFHAVSKISDFAQQAVVQESDVLGVGGAVWHSQATATLDLVEIAPGLVRGRVSSTEPRLMASSVLNDGNWQITAGNKRLAPLSVNGPFVGTWLSPGDYELTLRYWPRALSRGLLFAVLSLAGLCASVMWLKRNSSSIDT